MSANLLDGGTKYANEGTTESDGVWSVPANNTSKDKNAVTVVPSGTEAAAENQTLHVGFSLRAADGASVSLPYGIGYVDAAGHINWAPRTIVAKGTGGWQRVEGSLVMPSGMRMTVFYIHQGAGSAACEVTNPTLSYGSPVTLASSAHTPYATQDHLQTNYVTNSTFDQSNTQIKASVSDTLTQAKTYTDGQVETEVTNRNAAITESASEIKSEVSETYATQDSLAAANSAITQNANAISSEVTARETTDSNVSTLSSKVTQTSTDVTTLFTDTQTAQSTADNAASAASTAQSAASSAASAASAAQTTADAKARTFTTQPTVPYAVGDIYQSGTTVSICTTARATGSYTASDWVLTADKTSDNTAADTTKVNGTPAATVLTNITAAQNAASTADGKATAAQSTADAAKSAAATAQSTADSANTDLTTLAGKTGRVIYSSTEPTGDDANANNLWIDTDDGKLYTYSGSTWTLVTDARLTAAANAASAAQSTAGTAKANAAAAQSTADDAKSAATTLSTLIRESSSGVDVGKSSDGSTYSTSVARVGSDGAFHILTSALVEVAKYAGNLIELGKNSTSAIIKFCAGAGQISTFSEGSLYLSGTFGAILQRQTDVDNGNDFGIGLVDDNGKAKAVLSAEEFQVAGIELTWAQMETALQPVVLYNGGAALDYDTAPGAGTTGTVTLSESAANFKELTLYLTDNNGRYAGAFPLAPLPGHTSPSVGQTCDVFGFEAADGERTWTYIRRTRYTVSTATTLVPSNGGWVSMRSGFDVSFSADGVNYLKIYRVTGRR